MILKNSFVIISIDSFKNCDALFSVSLDRLYTLKWDHLFYGMIGIENNNEFVQYQSSLAVPSVQGNN